MIYPKSINTFSDIGDIVPMPIHYKKQITIP